MDQEGGNLLTLPLSLNDWVGQSEIPSGCRVVGTLVLRSTTFRKCNFQKIGFVGDKARMQRLKKRGVQYRVPIDPEDI